LKAKERGFDVRLIYVYVDTLERQLERIRLRVAKGGHDVPAEKAAARRDRSFAELPWFFWKANQAWILDNSGAEPRIVARKEDERHATISGALIPSLREGIGNFRADI
jgi:predicted ABC-type ATPase